MLSVFKNKEYQLVVETVHNIASLKIENRYGIAPELDLEIELTKSDVLKLYNQLGKLLGYPEMKGK